MFAVDCPYCQHANKPGARFCTDCGAPLHLKPCPKCGKVDDVTVRQCSGCGAAFPPIKLAPPAERTLPEESAAPGLGSVNANPSVISITNPDPGIAPPASTAPYRPGPLIAVALIAGGLPMLWMNRDLLPQPRAWRAEAPNPAMVAPPPVVTPNAAPVVSPPAANVPAIPMQSAAATAAAESAPAPSPIPRAAPSDVSAVSVVPAGKANSGQSTSTTEKKRARDPVAAAAATAPAAPQSSRPCTESLVALGLCDRSQVEK